MDNLFLSLEKEVFRGNVLDITYNSQGIIYSANKYYDDYIEIDYLENDIEECDLKNYYDSCIIFFSLRRYNSKSSRRKLFKRVHEMMSTDGYIYIWDIRKELFKVWMKNIKVVLPDKTIAKLQINDLNLFEEIAPEKVIESVKEYFEIVENINSKDYFKIVAKRKDV